MAASITDKLDRVTDSTTGRPTLTQLATPGKAIGASALTCNDLTNWTTTSKIHFSIYNVTSAGVKDPTTQTDWVGLVSGNTITNLQLTAGTDRVYNPGAIVDATPTAAWAKDLYDNVRSHANQDGSLITAAVQAALNISGGSAGGWTPLGFTPTSVVANGNRNYTLSFASDVTSILSPGHRLQLTRTTAAPTQCSALNGTNQYWNKTSLAGMTFTDNFTLMGWVKLTSYPGGSGSGIIGRYASGADDGYLLQISGTGQVIMYGAGAANRSFTSNQSIPLNKWVHIAATMTMSSGSGTIYIDGVSVPYTSVGSGTSLTQSGNLEIGSWGGGAGLLPGKVAQAAVFSSVLSQSTILSYMSQTLVGTETSLISAFAFNGNANDLNTTNANNLTANNGVGASTADSPFGGQSDGSISSTLDYGIVHSIKFSTTTTCVIQVPEGCTIPTSGTVASVFYSTGKVPYRFPATRDKWALETIFLNSFNQTSPTSGVFYNIGGFQLNVPIGNWLLKAEAQLQVSNSSNPPAMVIGLSTANNSITEKRTGKILVGAPAMSFPGIGFSTSVPANLSTATPYYFNESLYASGASSITLNNDVSTAGAGGSVLTAENALL